MLVRSHQGVDYLFGDLYGNTVNNKRTNVGTG
jgi:hypothetical protein